MNEKVSQTESFRKSSRATKEASIAYKQAKQELNILSKEIRATDSPSKALQNNFRKAKIAADSTKKSFIEAATATRAMGKALSASGVNFKTFNQQQEILGKTLTILKKRQTALQNNADAKLQNLSNRANYRSQMVDAVVMGGILYKMIKLFRFIGGFQI